MASARDTLFADLAAIASASDSEALFVSAGASQAESSAARLLRNGLAVVAFNSLEHFIDRRSVELLEVISAAPVAFLDLPDGWKRAATERVVSALHAQVRFMRSSGEDPTALIQDAGVSLASTRGAALNLSTLSLRWTGSNLNPDDVSGVLKILQVEQPWPSMTSVANRAGFGLAGGADEVFKSLLLARNAAAHEPTADTSILYLRSLPRTVAALAFAFDALASRATRLAASGERNYLSGDKVREADIGFRWLDRRGSRWAERREARPKRAFRIHVDYDVARREALARAAAEREVVVARNRPDDPVWWATGDTS